MVTFVVEGHCEEGLRKSFFLGEALGILGIMMERDPGVGVGLYVYAYPASFDVHDFQRLLFFPTDSRSAWRCVSSSPDFHSGQCCVCTRA